MMKENTSRIPVCVELVGVDGRCVAFVMIWINQKQVDQLDSVCCVHCMDTDKNIVPPLPKECQMGLRRQGGEVEAEGEVFGEEGVIERSICNMSVHVLFLNLYLNFVIALCQDMCCLLICT